MELAAIAIPALLTPSMNTLMPKMLELIQERSTLRRDVQNDITSLKGELEMMWSAVREHSKSAQRKDFEGVQVTWIKQVSQLAHKIEDCVDSYIYDQIASSNEVPNLDRFAADIKKLKKESDDIAKHREKYKVDAAGVSNSDVASEAGVSASSPISCPPVLPDLVGTESALMDLLDLMEEEQAEGQQKKLKVISIHGFDGLGKTALAAQVFGHKDVLKQFGDNRVWVNAEGKDPQQVLQELLQHPFPEKEEILQQLQTQPRDTYNNPEPQLCTQLRACLENKRYFIVIDDMRTYLWSIIKAAFPENYGYSSRVVVTTSFQPIAKGCCSTTGYVYRMPGLDASFSQELFFKSADVKEPSPELKNNSEELCTKCGGLPLALVSVAQLLNFIKDGLDPTGDTCNKVCCALGKYLETADKDSDLARMQEVLIRSYNCLTEDTAKACLLCIGMFPSGHQIQRKRLIRRWMAEGLFDKSRHHQHSTIKMAAENFKALIDCNIVQPIHVSNNDEVRSCQPPGMMLEFIRHRFISEKSNTLFCDKMLREVPIYARRLSLYHCTAENVQQGCNLSLVRSLTVFGKASREILDFDNYRLLRVLDLEECNELTNDHLKGICKLFLLNYLSLGRTVTQLPKEISKLKYLETLDVRRANVEVKIPIEVIMLTSLIHLYGKFKPLGKNIPEISKGGSNLEILAGFVIADGNDSFLQLITHMKNLRKVKIWYESSADSSNLTNLSSSIQRYIQGNNDANIARSLSLVSFKDVPDFNPEGDILHISSLKLRGDLLEVPNFIASLLTLRKLCLSSTTTLNGSLLAVLSKLTCLVYLKLVAAELHNFVLNDNTKFQSLQRICFEVQRSPFLEIEGNPLPQLVSFQLLCNGVENLRLINLDSIGRLREVTLYCIENEDSRNEWKNAAKRHPNRPRILFVAKESGHAEASVATEQPSPQKKKWWKAITGCLGKMFRPHKERTRSSGVAGTDNGHLDETTGVQAEASGSTERA
ncbi:unnamed protein product [Urochloa humidicola]